MRDMTPTVDPSPFKEFTAEERAAINAWRTETPEPPEPPIDWSIGVAGFILGFLCGAATAIGFVLYFT
jgi:hypothetical protein